MRELLLIAALPLVACSMSVDNNDGGVAATGGGNARDYAINGFTAVKLTGSDDVDVRIGPAFAIHATGPAKVLDRLKIERDGDTLRVGRKNGTGFSWGSDKGARIAVTMPAIQAAAVTGSGDLTIERAAGDSFKASSTGSGGLSIEALDVKHGEFSLTGSGDINAKGRAATLVMSVTGSGDIDAKGVAASRATVSVLGSGSANATVNGAADVSSLGSGDIDLGAGATYTVKKLGSGEVRCGK